MKTSLNIMEYAGLIQSEGISLTSKAQMCLTIELLHP